MKLKLLYILLSLKLTFARYAFVPKFYGQDSAVIVDTDKQLPPTPFNTKRYYHRFPVYQIIQPGKHMQIQQNEIASTTKSTTNKPLSVVDEFPRDLLVIAQKKLGLKSLDEIPSISELGELLGTDTADETISYIRQLTASEQGIALMKAYMEIDDGESDDSADIDDDDEDTAEENVDIATATADLRVVEDDISDDNEFKSDIVASDSSTPSNANKPKSGFFDKIASYLNIYNLLPQKQTTRSNNSPITTSVPEPQKSLQINPNGLPPQVFNNQKPDLMRNPLPYHYPIPLRPAKFNNTSDNPAKVQLPIRSPPSNNFKPLINTPKIIIPPHIQQLSKLSNIPPKKLESFLESKPKLAELAKRISNVSLSNGVNNAVNNQLMNAIKKAIEQDDDLRRLLSETDTLK
jgi:hypothetical protein